MFGNCLVRLSVSYFIIKLEVVLCNIWEKQFCNCSLSLFFAGLDPVEH